MNREKIKRDANTMCDHLRREMAFRERDGKITGSIVDVIALIEDLLVIIEDLEVYHQS